MWVKLFVERVRYTSVLIADACGWLSLVKPEIIENYKKLFEILIHRNQPSRVNPVKAALLLSKKGIAPKTSIRALIKLLEGNKDEEIRADAARALGEIGDPDAISVLRKTLQHRFGTENVRRSTIAALRKIGTPEALNTADLFKSERTDKVR